MAIFLIAAGPTLDLLARLTEWKADRKHVSLTPKLEVNPFSWSGITYLHDSTELENRGDIQS
jgi:hypothetical protein